MATALAVSICNTIVATTVSGLACLLAIQHRHLVLVLSQFNNQIRLYVNGTLQATVSLSNGFLSSGHLIIGAAKYGGNRVDYFNGLIDDVRVYNYGLSDSEVANLYNGGAGRATVLSAQSGTTPNQSTQVRPTFQPPTNTPSR